MGISIKNDEVEDLIRRVAAAMDKPITDAIRTVTADWLEAHGKKVRSDEEQRQKSLDDILARFRSWPVYDDREHGDMLYDDDGLPK